MIMPHFGIPPLFFISLFLGISGFWGGVAGWVVLCLKLDSMVRCEFACRYSWFKSRRDHGMDLLPCEPKFIPNWRCKKLTNVRLALKEAVVLCRWASQVSSFSTRLIIVSPLTMVWCNKLTSVFLCVYRLIDDNLRHNIAVLCSCIFALCTCKCTHNLWEKRKIPMRTSRGLKWKNVQAQRSIVKVFYNLSKHGHLIPSILVSSSV